MKFWDDSLRICPKCRKKVSFEGEERRPCPHCRQEVWFFNYRSLPDPPPIPEVPSNGLQAHPMTYMILGVLSILALLALLSFSNSLIVPMVCAIIAAGMCLFGIMRHAEAVEVEQKLAHYAKVLELADALRKQTLQLTDRYRSLLATGDARIQAYHRDIYEAAVNEKQAAAELRRQASLDRHAIKSVESRIYAMADRLVSDHCQWMTKKLRADPESYQRQKTTLAKTFDFVESVGYELPADIREKSLAELKQAYQMKVREQTLKEEQRRLKQQMREEARLLREHEKEIREAEAREAELADRLKDALSTQAGVHSQEVEELQRLLAEAQAKSERAKSMAQLTKVGHVYILSNVGSFGENIFKVGMTRREDPQDRVRELGDASVPFPFDVHAMVSCQNAPGLENALHRELTRHRVNRVNLRKEYFSVPLEVILEAVEKHHGIVEYIAEPEALEYRDSLNISPDEIEQLTEDLAEMGVNLNEDDEFEPVMETV